MRTTFIGGGTMAEAIIKGILAGGVVSVGDVTVVEPVAARRRLLSEQYGVSVSETASVGLSAADVVVLAVKPQELERVAAQVDSLDEHQLLISILAGVRIERLQRSQAPACGSCHAQYSCADSARHHRVDRVLLRT